ncbi:MAG TPA: biliverdin-producing heme oxygenase [Hyphomicrobiaceae bacterium]|jgi:heme oxygenase|nr:biliverdin-producing heme oxygenase [Hyphomicrobiaceae bacterium]
MASQHRATARSARGHLRAATSDLHARLDARLAPLVTQGEAGYRDFLLRSAMALLPVEQALNEVDVANLLPDWPQRSRSRALRLDLAALSLPEPSGPTVPAICGEAFQFGMLYVLEGSRLGARLLLAEVEAALSPASRAATRYLSHGQGLSLWPTFLQRLEASQQVRREPDAAAAGARAVFRQFLAASGDGICDGVILGRG